MKYSVNGENNNKLIDFLAAAIVFLMGCLRNGNLNLLYFMAPFLLIYGIKQHKKIGRKIVFMFIPFVLILIITYLYSSYFTTIDKSLIYLLKLFICITIYCVVRFCNLKINIYRVSKYLVFLIFFFTCFALVNKNDYLWRLGDVVNKYAKNRLQLFSQEPSELSEVCGILLLLNIYYLKIGIKRNYLGLVFIIIPLFLSAGLSGMVYSAIAILLFLFLTEFQTLRNGKISLIFLLTIILICLVAIFAFINPNNGIMLRINDIINGNDGSFNYRFTRSYEATLDILRSTKFIGVGLGNLRTDYMQLYLLNKFNLYSFSNSYLFFIAEGGLIAILYLLLLIINTIKFLVKISFTSVEKKFRYSLLLFIVVFQITGGYFTDPFLWLVTGLVASANLTKRSDNNV